jgi:hypothetical protein
MEYAGRRPYGDIYVTPTTALDNLSNKIYVEHKQQQAQRQAENKALDDEFAKNVTGIRDPDVDELTKKYGDFKMARMEALSKGNKITPQDQLNLLRKKADVFQLINKSKQEREQEKNALLDIAKNPDKYNEDARYVMSTRMKLPTNGLQVEVKDPATGQVVKRDLSDIDSNIRYQGGTTDFTKAKAAARGQLQAKGAPIEEVIDNGLSKKITSYKGINGPADIAGTLLEAANGSVKGRDFVYQHPFTDEEANDIITKFEQYKKTPQYQAAYSNAQDIPMTLMATPKGRTAALMAMKESMANPPVATSKTEPVYGARQNQKNAEWDRRNKLTYGQSLAKIRLNNQNRKQGLPDEDTGYLSDNVADEVGEKLTISANGKQQDKIVVWVDKVDPARLDIITGKDKSKGRPVGVKPITFKDGRKAFYVDPETGDWEGDKGQTISRERVKDDYIKSVSPTKFKVQVGTKGAEKRNTPAPPALKDPLKLF